LSIVTFTEASSCACLYYIVCKLSLTFAVSVLVHRLGISHLDLEKGSFTLTERDTTTDVLIEFQVTSISPGKIAITMIVK